MTYDFSPLDIAGLALIDALRETRRPLPTAAWRITQQVYRFDPDLYTTLLATPVAGEIPGEHFQRLPAWCVAVETLALTVPLVGGGDEPLHVFTWFDWRKDRGEDMTLGLDTDARRAVGHVSLVGTLEASLAAADWQEAVAAGISGGAPPEGYAQATLRAFAPILSLLLYCAPRRPTMRVPPDPP